MNTKVNLAAGVMNIILAVVLTVNTVIILLCLIACAVMPILLPIWFLPFVFLVPLFGCIFFVSLAANICNLIAGVGTVVASVKGGKISEIFAIISLVVDTVFIPVCALFFAYGVYSVQDEYTVNWLTVAITVASSLAVVLTVVSMILNAVSLNAKKKV